MSNELLETIEDRDELARQVRHLAADRANLLELVEAQKGVILSLHRRLELWQGENAKLLARLAESPRRMWPETVQEVAAAVGVPQSVVDVGSCDCTMPPIVTRSNLAWEEDELCGRPSWRANSRRKVWEEGAGERPLVWQIDLEKNENEGGCLVVTGSDAELLVGTPLDGEQFASLDAAQAACQRQEDNGPW